MCHGNQTGQVLQGIQIPVKTLNNTMCWTRVNFEEIKLKHYMQSLHRGKWDICHMHCGWQPGKSHPAELCHNNKNWAKDGFSWMSGERPGLRKAAQKLRCEQSSLQGYSPSLQPLLKGREATAYESWDHLGYAGLEMSHPLAVTCILRPDSAVTAESCNWIVRVLSLISRLNSRELWRFNCNYAF